MTLVIVRACTFHTNLQQKHWKCVFCNTTLMHELNPMCMKMVFFRARYLFTLALLLSVMKTWAQKEPMKFGDIDAEHLKMTSTPIDSAVDAVYLGCFGFTHYESRGDEIILVTDYHYRVKILNASAVDEFATIALAEYVGGINKEEVGNIKAASYNLENGEVVTQKMAKDAVMEERLDKRTNLVRFNIPGVKEGSVIEYTYTLRSDFLFSLRTWYFQKKYPVVLSEYRIIIPNIIKWQYYTRGANYPFATKEVKNDMPAGTLGWPTSHGRWVQQNLQGMENEPFLTTTTNYLSRLEFDIHSINVPGRLVQNLSATWENVGKALMEEESFSGYMKKCDFMGSVVDSVVAGKTSDLDKAKALNVFIQKRINWNEEHQVFTQNDPKTVWFAKKGSAQEINLLLYGAFRLAGLDAFPVVTSTRSNGYFERPDLNLADYVLVGLKSGENTLFFDATRPTATPGYLPAECINYFGAKYSGLQTAPVAIRPQPGSKQSAFAILNLRENSHLEGNITTTYSGYLANAFRTKIEAEEPEDRKTEIEEDLGGEVKEYSTEMLDSLLSSSVKETIVVDVSSGDLNIVGDLIYLTPLLHLKEDENPFQLEKRVCPVEFPYPFEHTATITINYPEGFTPNEIPKPAIVKLPDNGGQFMYQVQNFGNTIQVMSSVSIKKTDFNPEEYIYLRQLYDLILQKQAEPVVLKKS